VVRIHTECGQWVGEGDTVAEIVSVGAYEAWLDVPQRYAAAVKRSSALVHLQIDATGRSTEPRKPVIVPQVDPMSRSFSIVIPVDDPEEVLVPGMSVTGWVPTGDRAEHLTIPRDALLRNQAGFYVYVARRTAGGSAHATPVPVIVDFETPHGVAVTASGLAEGDLVVVEGNERLFPMMPIAPAPAARDAREGP
jgi:RND family efflux transporter MFP subunit